MHGGHERPRHQEEEYFAKREAGILKAHRAAADQVVRDTERRSHYMKCPKCGASLVAETRAGMRLAACPDCHGVWFDAADAETLTRTGSHEAVGSLLTALARGMRTSHAAHATPTPHESDKG